MDSKQPPNLNEIQALTEFKAKFGRQNWKDELAFLYYGGGSFDYHPHAEALKSVINRLGLEWLNANDISDDGKIVPAEIDPVMELIRAKNKLFSLGNDPAQPLSGWAFHVVYAEDKSTVMRDGTLRQKQHTDPYNGEYVQHGVYLQDATSAGLCECGDTLESVCVLLASKIEDLKQFGQLSGMTHETTWEKGLEDYGSFVVKGDIPLAKLLEIKSTKDVTDLVMMDRALKAKELIENLPSERPAPKSARP
jgi:hypothetical protein